MKTICEKCNRSITPIFPDHIYNGTESILHGHENIQNGSENIRTGCEKNIYNYKCPYCGTIYKTGYSKK